MNIYLYTIRIIYIFISILCIYIYISLARCLSLYIFIYVVIVWDHEITHTSYQFSKANLYNIYIYISLYDIDRQIDR